MDIYIADENYRRISVVEGFESFIWAERFREWGDFRLTFPSTRENRLLYKPGLKLVQSESHRVMILETVEDKVDQDGRATLHVSGRSLEAILDSRLARDSLSDLISTTKWFLSGQPATLARLIFTNICITGTLDAGDVLPVAIETPGLVYPEDTTPEPVDTVAHEIDPQSLYSALKILCEIYHMGFRLYRDHDTGNLYFGVYMGSDRTTLQTTLPAVIFSPDLDNLKNVTELTTDALFKNVAYVISPVGHEVVYDPETDPGVSGFERKVLFVKAEDIEDVDPGDASDRMIQRGLEELSKSRRFSGFDGELVQLSQYKYGVDYNLGDLVQLQSLSGAINIMQVTEQIFVSDREGERSYPTLSMNKFIAAGAWDALAPTMTWDDIDSDVVWDEFE